MIAASLVVMVSAIIIGVLCFATAATLWDQRDAPNRAYYPLGAVMCVVLGVSVLFGAGYLAAVTFGGGS